MTSFSLGKYWEDYVALQIEQGRFNNASEVIRDALRLQEEYTLKLDSLRSDIDAGVRSVRNGRVSRATPEDIKKHAKARRKA